MMKLTRGSVLLVGGGVTAGRRWKCKYFIFLLFYDGHVTIFFTFSDTCGYIVRKGRRSVRSARLSFATSWRWSATLHAHIPALLLLTFVTFVEMRSIFRAIWKAIWIGTRANHEWNVTLVIKLFQTWWDYSLIRSRCMGRIRSFVMNGMYII